MLKRHEVEILLKAAHSKAEVARLAGVSLRSVNRIAAEAPVVHVDDAVEREKRRIGRPSIVEDFREIVVKILEEKSDLAWSKNSNSQRPTIRTKVSSMCLGRFWFRRPCSRRCISGPYSEPNARRSCDPPVVRKNCVRQDFRPV